MATFLTLLSPPSSLVPVGGAWVLDVSTSDQDGYLNGSVTPTVAATNPAGVVTAPVAVAGGTGEWTVTLTPTVAGRWLAHLSTPEDAVDVAAYVLGPTTTTGMPVVSDVATYLGQSAGSWSTEDLQDALNAERSAQRDRCGERAYYPDSLRQALLRRVHRNLAMRRLPLAVPTGDADGNVGILPGRDPEVRRLEGPYRRRPVG